MMSSFWHHAFFVKILALEDIYADPPKLDAYLASGEPVAVLRDGQAVAEFVLHKEAMPPDEGVVSAFADTNCDSTRCDRVPEL